MTTFFVGFFGPAGSPRSAASFRWCRGIFIAMALDVVDMVAVVLMGGTTARQVGRTPPLHVRDTPRARRRTAGEVGREFMAVAVERGDAAASLCFGRGRDWGRSSSSSRLRFQG